MPIYEFECVKGHRTEELFSSAAAASEIIICPKCKQEAQRIVSMPGDTIFIGEGFYKPSKNKYAADKEKHSKK